ncbi:2567a8ef-67dd-4f7b-a6cc-829dab80fcd4 [Sclerotinia trifoliorum]|uniref:NADPH-dependent diflavin oxidoreductase 1 n=1 Tax=Sclerotinia trifoliorum TaxID=28548 RepID=A0A8H2VXT0_9HELO|nr:2567a8ef-67dd-4f7b-a6cc-829dab80fcd4 [Sclerotinia trifoliorum]
MSEISNGQRHDRSALVLYGTETGNSQDVAEELGRVTERLHFMTRVCEMDEVDIKELLKYQFVIFTISTTGQGEFPKNSRKFWNSLLRKRLPPDCLSHVNFATFGLGDSSYAKFNFAARKLHKRLEQLGGNEIYPRGEADEQHEEGVDGTFLSWYIDLKKKLLELYPLPDGLEPIPDDVLLPPKYWLELKNESTTVTEKLNSPLDNSGEIDHTELDSLNSTFDGQSQKSSISEDGTMSNTSGFGFGLRFDHGYDAPKPSNRLTGPYKDDELESVDLVLPESRNFTDVQNGIHAIIQNNKRITPLSHWQDVREITFRIRSQEFSPRPGDTISIFPKNFPEDVQTLIDLMEWNDVADMKLHFKPRSPDWFAAKNLVSSPKDLHLVDDNQTLRELLIHNLDFQAIPKRHFFEIMANYTDDPTHKARLLEFRDPVYTDELYDYTTRPRRSILECLQDFPSVKLPWKDATTIFPIIRAREFSISSGGTMHNAPEELNKAAKNVKDSKNSKDDEPLDKPVKNYNFQILVAIVKYRTVLQKVRNGLCSRYLATLPEGSVITISYSRNASFYKAPKALKGRPLILVGAGTGIAPLRSLIRERAKQMMYSKCQGTGFGDVLLIYGGRNRDADYFYGTEWEKLKSKVHANPVFSRDGPQKVYVQDQIRKQGQEIADLLTKYNALIYVCGSSGGMPKAVRLAFLGILQKHGDMSFEEAGDFVANMEKSKFYIQETW